MKKLIALTFDDGPNLPTTSEVLDKLEHYGVPAVFFICADRIDDETVPVLKRACELGCEIGNHTRTHPFMDKLTAEEMLEEINFTTEKITEVLGSPPKYFRPPYFAVNELVLNTVPLPIMGGYDADDWLDENDAEFRAREIIRQAADGAIVLLHDQKDNCQTVDALDIIIPELKSKGFEFVTITDLFNKKGVVPEKHCVYFKV